MTARNTPRILASGAVTPAGYDARASAFVARTGALVPEPLGAFDHAGRQVHGYRVAAVDSEVTAVDRLMALAVPALVQAGAGFAGDRIALYLALPEPNRPDLPEIEEHTLLARLGAAAGVPIDSAASRVVRIGRSGGAWTLEAALSQARAGLTVIAGGVDSLLDPLAVAWLDGAERLGTEERDGLVPSEAAAFLRIGPSADASLVALEDARFFGPNARADAVAWLRGVPATPAPWLLTDLDGEPRRAVDLAEDLITTGRADLTHDDLWALYGAVGAATVPLLAAYVDVASRHGFAAAERAVIRAGGLDAEGVGAATLARGAVHA